jgi:hypothetical protein
LGALNRVVAEQLKTRLEKAGFVDVQTFTVKQPVGPTPPLWALRDFSARGKVLIAKS